MNQTTRLALWASLIVAVAAPAAAGGRAGGVTRISPLAAMAVQPEVPIELLMQAYRRAEVLKQQEMTLALKERARGNLKAMELHLKRAAELGSKEARKLLDAMKLSKARVH
jgi:hypothetical protein